MGAWIRTMAVITFVGLSQISFCTAPMFTSGSTFAPFNTGPNRLSNWGGYIAAGSTGEFNSISAEWTVPIVKCLADGNLYAPWVGIDGYGSTTVEQTGVQTDCKTGSPVDSAWYEMYPARPVYYANPVSTGDSIVASVIYSGKSFVLTITDTTKGWTRTVDKTARRASRLSAEAVIEAPGGYPAITKVQFAQVLINGTDLASFDPVRSITGSGTGRYVPGPIKNGTSFTIKR